MKKFFKEFFIQLLRWISERKITETKYLEEFFTERIPSKTENPSAGIYRWIYWKISRKCKGTDSGVISAWIAEKFFGEILKASPEKFLKESLQKGLNKSKATPG